MSISPMYGNNPYYPTTYPAPYMPNSTYPANIQPSLINGRSVNSVEEITAGEVPLNGSLAVFPKTDGSMIYVKSTNGNGTIDTKYYIPAPEGFVENPGSSTEESEPVISNQDILAAILNLQNQVDNIQTIVKNRPGKPGNYNKRYNNQNGTQEKVENNA